MPQLNNSELHNVATMSCEEMQFVAWLCRRHQRLPTVPKQCIREKNLVPTFVEEFCNGVYDFEGFGWVTTKSPRHKA